MLYKYRMGEFCMRDDKPLWIPSRASIEASPIYHFMQHAIATYGLSMSKLQ
jgi:acetoacetyl-CoA synthetase